MSSATRYCSSCGAAYPAETVVCSSCGLSLKITAPLTPTHLLLQQRYRILAQLGKGGSSVVYKAEDTLLNNRLVAIKVISLRGLRSQEVIEATETFNREILLLSDLNHPNLPHVYSNFAEAESWYLVMDFIEGITLEKHLENMQDGRLSIGEVLEIGLLLCTVLEYLHTHQPAVIFRDLKPANVMLTPDGRIALIDFGIARHFKPGQAKDTVPFGSPGYAAPEQYGKAQTTPRTDIYSLGAMLHQLLTGDDPSLSPFRFAPLPKQAEFASFEILIKQMVEMNVDNRPENITVVTQELQRLADEWSMQYRFGVKARGPYSSHQPPPAFFQALLPPAEVTGIPLAVSGNGQMSPLQHAVPGKGSALAPSASSSSTYWSTPTRQKRHNIMAIASLVFGILTPLLICLSSAELLDALQHPASRFMALLILILLATLPMLAVIFGHIGIHRARTVHGLGESKEIAMIGLLLGYFFGSIYLLLIISLIVSYLSFLGIF